MVIDTIFAPITNLGGAVNVIRVSGKGVIDVLRNLGCHGVDHGTVRLCVIKDKMLNENIDTALVTFFSGPKSFTGEDVAEFSLHGGNFILQKFYSALTKFGCRFAMPGEFTKRAVINQKIDLLHAEGINMMVRSETATQYKLASSLMYGQVGNLYNSWRSHLLSMLAMMEVAIDFPDEIASIAAASEVFKEHKNILYSMKNYLDETIRNKDIAEGIKIAIIGEPNAGKSSIMNYISQRDIAIVSDVPGTTRDAIESTISLDGYMVTFIDTAGLRDSNDFIEIEGMKRSRMHMQNSSFNLIIFDGNNDVSCIHASMKCLMSNDIFVVNKIDLLSDEQLETLKNYILEYMPNQKVFYTSTLHGLNMISFLDKLSREISARFSLELCPMMVNARHRNLIERSIQALQTMSQDDDLEISSEYLRLAVNYLDQVVGKILTEDVLGAIFSKFCIGK